MSALKTTDIGLIPCEWDCVLFNEVAELRHGHQFRSYDFTTDGLKVVKITQIKRNGTINLSSCSFIESNRLEEFNDDIIYKGDILIALTGATIGKIARYNSEEVVLQNYRVGNFFSKDENKLNRDYLFQFLRSNLFFHQILARQTQSAQQNIGKDEINNMDLFLPPLPEQKAIAKVLTVFDDKIELLQAQNKTLETMAQTIFKEWFGKYQIGDELPEGWRVGKLGDIANLKSGYAFKSKEFVKESTKKALKIKDLKGDGKVSLDAVSCVSNDVTKLSRVQYFRLKEGDIVLAMSGNTTGKIGVIPPHSNEVYLNQRVGKFFMIKQDLNSFLYSFLMSGNYEEKILSMGYGSAQPNISPSQIENIDIIYPNEEKLVSYLNISNPIFNKVLDNNNQIQSHTKTRDTLLPKLMSGQVRVNNIKQTANA
tara:strand:- start:891 stop:2165 length:1275 start_codon:yes stop_codon:yes gene_type:complete